MFFKKKQSIFTVIVTWNYILGFLSKSSPKLYQFISFAYHGLAKNGKFGKTEQWKEFIMSKVRLDWS